MQTTTRAFYLLIFCALALTGCGGDAPETASTSASATNAVDPCTLLTATEIEATMGLVTAEAERQSSNINSCQWPNVESPFPVVFILLSPQKIGSWEDYRDGMIEHGLGDPDTEGEQIDMGRFAHYQPDSAMIQVQTEQGFLLTLMARGANKAQVIDLASKALARLP